VDATRALLNPEKGGWDNGYRPKEALVWRELREILGRVTLKPKV
jgi:hypothetical protein